MNEEKITCAYCGCEMAGKESWPHVNGDYNTGVTKIDYFCSENHKIIFLSS
jgi:hypothetical protein